jgi:hypothetical protein
MPHRRRQRHIRNILVVYSLVQHPTRQTIRDSLDAFGDYSNARCYFLNLGVRRVPWWLRRIEFDAVIFHTTFLSERWNPPAFRRVLRRAGRLRGMGRFKAALPQDEFLRSGIVQSFVESFDVDHIFSVGPPSTWLQLYPEAAGRVALSRVLTGYLHPGTVERIERIVDSSARRPIDIGYRSRHMAPWLGRHGQLKGQIGEAVKEAAQSRGLRVDISTRASDTLSGDDWYRFLASCRYTIGVEGGASVHDPDGTVKECADRYASAQPSAAFAEVERECFPGRDGEIDYRALSPRHLEACATRTCQVLVEGEYSGVLKPEAHYIPLRQDLSNLDQVLDRIQADADRARLVETAYDEVVASGEYTYERLIREVEGKAFVGPPASADGWSLEVAHLLSRIAERAARARVALYVAVGTRLRVWALRTLPEPALRVIRRRVAGTTAEAAAMQSAD